MDKDKNIYEKNETPPLAKKNKRRKQKVKPVADGSSSQNKAIRSSSTLYSERERHESMNDLTRRRSSRRHSSSRSGSSQRSSSSRRRKRRSSRTANKILLVILAILLVGYIGLLGSTFLKKSEDKKKPKKPVSVLTNDFIEADSPFQQEKPAAVSGLEAIEELIVKARQANQTQTRVDALLADDYYEKASQALENGLANMPKHHRLQRMLAEVYEIQKRYSKAEELLMEVLHANPDDIDARIQLARILNLRKDYQAALSMANWVLDHDPYSFEGHDLAATAHFKLGKTSWALPHLRKMLSAQPDDLTVQSRLAQAYVDLDQYDRAIRLLLEILSVDKLNSSVYYNLAICYAQQEDAEHCTDILYRATALFGKPFVQTWLESDLFNPVRSMLSFQNFMEDFETTADQAAAMPPRNDEEL